MNYQKRIKLKLIMAFFLFSNFLLVASQVQAMKIEKSKGRAAIIDLENSSVAVDEVYQFTGKDNSKVSLKIKKLKNSKAVASVIDGQLAEPLSDYKLQKKLGPTAAISSLEKTQAAGGQVGFSQNAISVKLLETSTIGMAGNGFLLSGFYQKTLTKKYDVQGRFFYNSIKVASDPQPQAICSGGSCFVNITYLDFGVLFKYKFPLANQILWLGLGLDILYASDKSSNILDPSNIGMQQKLTVGAGIDWGINAKSFIPVSIEYGTFINKISVTASQIILNTGYGIRF